MRRRVNITKITTTNCPVHCTMPCTKQVFNIFKPLSDLSVPSRSLNRLGDNKDVKLVSSVSYLDWDPFHIPTSRPAAVNSLFVVQFLSVRQQSVLSQLVNQSQSVSESVSESVSKSVSQSVSQMYINFVVIWILPCLCGPQSSAVGNIFSINAQVCLPNV